MENDKPKYARGKHPNTLKAQHHFKKDTGWAASGGNTKGRPTKEKSITEALRVLLKSGTLTDVKHTTSETIVETLAKNWIKEALKNARYFEMMLDRIEGKEVQPISGEGGGAILISVVSENAKKLTQDIVAGKGTTVSGHDETEP